LGVSTAAMVGAGGRDGANVAAGIEGFLV